MPQNYTLYPTQFFAFFTTLLINEVASQFGKKIKNANDDFFGVFMLLRQLRASHQAMAQAFFNSVIKTQTPFLNHYLVYASSCGIGGGGGHGNAFV